MYTLNEKQTKDFINMYDNALQRSSICFLFKQGILNGEMAGEYSGFVAISDFEEQKAIGFVDNFYNKFVKNGTKIGKVWSLNHSAALGKNVSLKDDCNIMAYCKIGDNVVIDVGGAMWTNSSVGNGSYVGNSSAIGTNSRVGKNTIIASRVSIGDEVVIGDNCIIGFRAKIRDGVKIGNNVTISERAVVSDNIPDGGSV